jgi:ATP-binding cassette subfamily B protein
MAKDRGLKAKFVHLKWKKLFYTGNACPFIARLRSGKYVIVSGVRGEYPTGEAGVVDPSTGSLEFQFLARQEFEEMWAGETLLLKKIYGIKDTHKPFDLSWFIPEILRHKKLFRDVAIATIVVNILALGFSMYVQLVMEKNLGHRATSTLLTLSVAMVTVSCIDRILCFIKSYIVLFAISFIDLRLDKAIFAHHLRLPIDSFTTTSSAILRGICFKKSASVNSSRDQWLQPCST